MKPLIKLLLLVIIIAVLSAFTGGHHAGKTSTSTADSVIMAQHVRELKFNSLGELTDGNPRFTDDQIDSIMASINVSIAGTGIFTTPDDKLKIFMITEEFCGAYCNYAYTSYVHLRNGKKLRGANELHNIDSIYRLPDGKYLIMQSWSERAFSACSDNAMAATVISVQSDSVILHPAIFNTINPHSTTDTMPIGFRTSYVVDSPCYLHYNPLTRTLQYQHGNPCGAYNNEYEMHTGYFIYQRGTFIQAKDSVWVPKADAK